MLGTFSQSSTENEVFTIIKLSSLNLGINLYLPPLWYPGASLRGGGLVPPLFEVGGQWCSPGGGEWGPEIETYL